MQNEEHADKRRYVVVINDEEQYSIWFETRALPPGWRAAGKSGTRAECLEHIEQVWTDMRPLSVRRAIEEVHGMASVEPGLNEG